MDGGDIGRTVADTRMSDQRKADGDPDWKGFRALGLEQRRAALERYADAEAFALSGADPAALELADLMVESAIGYLPVPLGLATGFIVDGKPVIIPMATEEPSVIAAATHGARLAALGGGFETAADEPLMSAQVYLEGVSEQAFAALRGAEPALRAVFAPLQRGLEARGGGFRGLETRRLSETGLVAVDLTMDVRDAMGANILNTAAEAARPTLERLSGGRALMCILSNAAEKRRAAARFRLPLNALEGRLQAGYSAREAAERLALASRLAHEDPARAVTHNKGIMNGVSALCLATLNDTRAVEAAAHAWASRSGRYRALSLYHIDGDSLVGELELPLALGTVGGAVEFHGASRYALALLGHPDARGLARIAAALGLAQNFAAVLALVTGGIQRGHMRYHAARLAYKAGARGKAIREIAEELAARGPYTFEDARALVAARAAAGAAAGSAAAGERSGA